MFDQTTLGERQGYGERHGYGDGHRSERPDQAARDMQRSMGDFAHDVATLAELQAELAEADLKEVQSRIILPAVSFGLAVGLGLACFPIVLAAVGMAFYELAGLPLWGSFLLATVIGLVVTGGLAGLGWWRMKHAGEPLNRSYSEFRRNIRWMLDVMKRSRRVRRECS